jgi:16S rRNA processing protein RimM
MADKTRPDDAAPDPQLVLLGAVAGAHGIRGEVKLVSFTDPPDNIAAYGPLSTASGHSFVIERLRPLKGNSFAVTLKGVTDRNTAEGLKSTQLFVARAALPEPDEDEWYHGDLIGLSAETESGERLGEIVAVHDFGAGDLIEVGKRGEKGTVLVPFTKECVPVIDVRGGRVVIVPPEEIGDESEPS